MPFGSNTFCFLFMGGTVGGEGVIQNILMPCDFINERSSRWSTVAKQCHLDQGLYIFKEKLKL